MKGITKGEIYQASGGTIRITVINKALKKYGTIAYRGGRKVRIIPVDKIEEAKAEMLASGRSHYGYEPRWDDNAYRIKELSDKPHQVTH